MKASPWRNGKGDVVAELAAGAKEAGIALGLYLSPWDRHESCYGKTLQYNEFYIGQMTELLTRYSLLRLPFLSFLLFAIFILFINFDMFFSFIGIVHF